jgi:response regulator RpfG family c-di-GMP phosphodiesterase
VTSLLTKKSANPAKPGARRVLCVDDEPYVLDGLRDNLRKSFEIRVAESGLEGLELLRREPEAYAIVISDMRMPAMPGSVFLREARREAPDAIRMLLTGYADVDAAVRAVNDGQLFRFLTKPCAPEELLRACAAAMAQHRLVVAERVLLEQTLSGSVQALTDVLALTSPAAFGRGTRVKASVARLAQQIEMTDAWEVGLAAMLAQLGAVTLPVATAEKLYSGGLLSTHEDGMVARVPETTQRLLGHIPRLEGVLEVLAHVDRQFEAATDRDPLPVGSRMLRIVFDYDELESAGAAPDVRLETMRGRRGVYDPELLAAFEASLGLGATSRTIREIGVDELRVGVTLADDVRSDRGALLIARGYPVSQELLERLRNLEKGQVREPLRILEGPVEGP